MSEIIEQIVIANAPLNTSASEFLISISPHYPSILITGLIGIGSILTSIAVVYVTYKNQKSQNQTKLAEFKYQWLQEFRSTASDFIGVCTHIRSCFNNNSFEKGQFDLLQMRGYMLRSQLTLMLDDGVLSDVIQALTAELIDSASDQKSTDEDFMQYLRASNLQFKTAANDYWVKVRSNF